QQEAQEQLVAQVTSQGERVDLCKLHKSGSSADERARQNGVSRRTQRKLDYLARHAPERLTQVQARSMSIHKAYTLARGIQETPLTTLHRVWRKVPTEDRLRFLTEMLTPAERRALQA